jgi:hypothetical protein
MDINFCIPYEKDACLASKPGQQEVVRIRKVYAELSKVSLILEVSWKPE